MGWKSNPFDEFKAQATWFEE